MITALVTAYGMGVLSGVLLAHRVAIWWRWGDRGRY